MPEQPAHHVTALLRSYATKMAADKAAANGSPDRMTTADGQGGITASKGTVPADPGEAELKVNQPTDGAANAAQGSGGGSPDRMTTADGQGGITASKGTVPKDPGEAELKRNQPADGISKKASKLRAALIGANSHFADKLGKSASGAAPTGGGAPQAPAAPQPIDLSESTLAKIASAMLSTDEGARQVYRTLEKQAGEAAARAQIQEAIEASAVYDEVDQVKSAAIDDIGYKARAIYDGIVQVGITEEDADAIIKQAAFHQTQMAAFDHEMLKAAYAGGMDDAALLAAAEEAGGAEGAPPVEEAMPMGGEELGEEEIIALLEEMLAAGEITEEQIAEAVAAAGGGGGADPAAAGGEDPAAMMGETVPV